MESDINRAVDFLESHFPIQVVHYASSTHELQAVLATWMLASHAHLGALVEVVLPIANG
jgi:hypothetical protein